MKRKEFLTAAPLVALAFAAGCKPDEPTASGSPGAGGVSPGASPKPIRIVYIPKNSGNPYFDGIVRGFDKGCKELDVTFATTAPAQPDPTSQISFLKDEIQRGASVIAITPNSVDALNAVFDEARGKGVKILCVNADITGNESHRDACVLPTDFNSLGENQIKLLASLIDNRGKFAILSATTDAPDQNFWITGMRETLKRPVYRDMTLVDVVYGDDKDQKSVTVAEALLTKHPDLRAILAPTSVGVAAAAKVVETRGVYPGGKNAKGPGVVVTGLGTPDQMRRFLKDRIIPAVALWNPPDQGYLAAYVAVALAKGELKIEDGQPIAAGSLGAKMFGHNGVLVAGNPLIFNIDNVDDYHF